MNLKSEGSGLSDIVCAAQSQHILPLVFSSSAQEGNDICTISHTCRWQGTASSQIVQSVQAFLFLKCFKIIIFAPFTAAALK